MIFSAKNVSPVVHSSSPFHHLVIGLVELVKMDKCSFSGQNNNHLAVM